jgi:hypothetical protein
VHLEAGPELVGQIVPVRIVTAHRGSLTGELAGDLAGAGAQAVGGKAFA